jgi:hypothetical protein
VHVKGAAALACAAAFFTLSEGASASEPPLGVPGDATSSFAFRQVVFSLAGEAVETEVGRQRVDSWNAGVDATFLAETTWLSQWGAIGEASFGGAAGGEGGRPALAFSAKVDGAGQYVFRLAPGHGPLLALGFRFETFWDFPPGWTWLEAPRLEAGYRYEAGDVLVRATAYASLLAGAGKIDTSTSGSTVEPDYGARVLISVRGSSLSIYAHHVVDAGDNSGVPVDQATASACLFLVKSVQACARASLFRAPALLYSPAEAEWRVWSFELGVGATSQIR